MVLKALHDDGSAVANARGRYVVVFDIVDSRSEAARILDAAPTREIRTDDEGALEIVICATRITEGVILFKETYQLDSTILVALETDTGELVFVLSAPNTDTYGFLAFLVLSDSVNGITLAVRGVDYTRITQAELEGQCPPRAQDE
jgi:hypothetical protein